MALVLILAAGQDPVVLSSRCSVLRSAGYIVQSASSIAEAIDRYFDVDFDFVLLCHSIPVEDRDRLIRVIRSSGSQIPIYTVDSASVDFQTGLADGILSSGPGDLIKELDATLRKGALRNSTGLTPLEDVKKLEFQ